MEEPSIKNTSFLHNIIHARRLILTLTVAIPLVLSVYFITINSHAQTDTINGTDILRFKTTDDDEWRYYDPHSQTEIEITFPDDAFSYTFSPDGRAAFTKKNENSTELYVFDPRISDIIPTKISETSAENWYSPLRWSPDGRYLAFGLWLLNEEIGNYDDSLYVWDGETVTNITPDDAPINVSENPTEVYYAPFRWSPDGRYLVFGLLHGTIGNYTNSFYVWDGKIVTNITPDNELDIVYGNSIDWSRDGRLAFTIKHREEDNSMPSEIFVLDGEMTTNLSQNPTGADWGAIWSDDGQLAFMSVRDDVEGIYVWDGVSFNDGLPDSDSFIYVSRDFQLPEDDNPQYPMPDPIWTNEGFVGFLVIEEVAILSPRRELVLWDVETQEIAMQFRSPDWAGFGGWNRLRNGQLVNHYWGIASGRGAVNFEIRDTRGRLLLSTGVGGWLWSPAGYLAFCDLRRADTPGLWVVAILDGQDIHVVVETTEVIEVQWASGGERMNCWDG